ncbi:hypothetical protein [Microbacterium xanthum]|uniref:hypothetical protein n=1 Tax=Microbacterium xanthum TaxID=3079794 RepID=UPI002AD4DF8C|nr:hypothetical protein [Microbacterium sp. KSW-48]MDZ8172566.1 hypothetical protein [Microbacterium sp. KSW-48]
MTTLARNFLRPARTPTAVAADAVRVIGLMGVVVAFVLYEPTDAGILAFTLPGLMLPRFVAMRPAADLLFGVILLTAAWSNVYDLYTTVPAWDLVVHFAATGAITVATYLLLAHARVVAPATGHPGARRSPLVLSPIIGLAVSALWEMVEWAGREFVTDSIYVTYADTIGDMAIGAVGAASAGVLLAVMRLSDPPAGA